MPKEDLAPASEGSGCVSGDQAALERLRAFARGVMRSWPMGDVDGGELQELAVEHGLLRPEIRTEPCGENCNCSGYPTTEEWAAGITCYRKTELLTSSTGGAEEGEIDAWLSVENAGAPRQAARPDEPDLRGGAAE